MFKNVNKMMYVYGFCMFFFLFVSIIEFRTIDLLFFLSINAITTNYIVARNFVF